MSHRLDDSNYASFLETFFAELSLATFLSAPNSEDDGAFSRFFGRK